MELRVDPPRRLVFSWASGGATEAVRLPYGFPCARSRDDHQVGRTETLVQLAGPAKVGFSAFGILTSMVEGRRLLKDRD